MFYCRLCYIVKWHAIQIHVVIVIVISFHSFVRLSVCPFIPSLVHSLLIQCLIHSFVRSFFHSLVGWFIHSLILSFIWSVDWLEVCHEVTWLRSVIGWCIAMRAVIGCDCR